jgi:phosphate-selective porin OprO/OprP
MQGWVLLACGWIAAVATPARGAPLDVPPAEAPATDQPSAVEQQESSESDFAEPQPRTIKPGWTEYDLKWLTFRWGIFTLEDWGNVVQSNASRAQLDIDEGFKVRDFRFTIGGKFATKRPITYTSGIMYDGPSASWLVRETGIQIGIPELWGTLFIGRQKEGISLSKITTGYAVWTMERTPITDAAIPILADGVKWLGGLPNHRANWNFSFYYNEWLSGPAKDWYDMSAVGRVAVLPVRNDATGALLHVAAAYRWGQYANGVAQLDSRPESSTAPFVIDTGVFPAEQDHMVGLELYYRRGSWFGGAEYFFDFVDAPQVGDPMFHGGNVFVTWLMTGEQRPYIDVGGKAGFVKPKRSAFSGGPGAWEALLNYSYADLDDAQITGGTFWRLTPGISWYIDDMTSFRWAYGLGSLDRFGTQQLTHFLQARFEVKIQ